MTYPGAWQFTLLALAAYRLTRLAGWDDFPLAVKIRSWATGLHWIDDQAGAAEEIGMPGKPPHSEVPTVRHVYDRPLVAHLVTCPFCIGAWLSFGVYMLWEWQPHWSLVGLTPFALSGVVGLVAKNLDA